VRLPVLQALAAGALLFATPAFAGPSGAELHAEMLASIGTYEDPELTAYLEGLVDEIVSVSEMADEKFTFTLLDSGDINAFARNSSRCWRTKWDTSPSGTSWKCPPQPAARNSSPGWPAF
jgi:hypothetical protein